MLVFACYAAFLASTYLFGSLPFGYLYCLKVTGEDIRNSGSFESGSWNVFQGKGWKIGVPVLLLDLLKGIIPVVLGRCLGGEIFGGVCLLTVMLGHSKSVYFYLKEGVFSGGKGVAAAFGGILALKPEIALPALALWALLLAIPPTRYVSLASMSAGIAAFGMCYVYHLSLEWHLISGAIALMLLYTHRRALARLVQGAEEREWAAADPGPLTVNAFVIHPTGWGDLAQSPLSSWLYVGLQKGVFTEKFARWVLTLIPLMEFKGVKGMQTLGGKRVQTLLEGIFMIPDMLKLIALADEVDEGKTKRLRCVIEVAEFMYVLLHPDDKRGVVSRDDYRMGITLRKLLWKRLKSAAVQACRRGAEVLGLGALLSTLFNGGGDLQAWCDERKLGLTIDNGAAYTAVATVVAIQQEFGKSLKGVRIAVIGGTGFIGRITVWRLKQLGADIVVIGRNAHKLEGFDPDVETSIDISSAYDCQIVVLTTSSKDPVITLANCVNFQKGTLFADAAVPVDFQDEILSAHPEMEFKLIRCGLIKLPTKPGGKLTSGIDFHFGKDEDGQILMPGCFAQATMLALLPTEAERRKYASLSNGVQREDFPVFAEMARRHGLKVISSGLSEKATFTGAAPSN